MSLLLVIMPSTNMLTFWCEDGIRVKGHEFKSGDNYVFEMINLLVLKVIKICELCPNQWVTLFFVWRVSIGIGIYI